jgi:K(+)-stimulated pyrophosphate-energized sodium pump
MTAIKLGLRNLGGGPAILVAIASFTHMSAKFSAFKGGTGSIASFNGDPRGRSQSAMPIGLVLGTGLLTTVSVIVSMDSFGWVTDNAQCSADLSGDLEGDAAAALTHLHTVGNTTKGIAKGSATATAVLAATAPSGLSAAQPNILVGVIIGEMMYLAGDPARRQAAR